MATANCDIRISTAVQTNDTFDAVKLNQFWRSIDNLREPIVLKRVFVVLEIHRITALLSKE